MPVPAHGLDELPSEGGVRLLGRDNTGGIGHGEKVENGDAFTPGPESWPVL
jgi:hypothetical protein